MEPHALRTTLAFSKATHRGVWVASDTLLYSKFNLRFGACVPGLLERQNQVNGRRSSEKYPRPTRTPSQLCRPKEAVHDGTEPANCAHPTQHLSGPSWPVTFQVVGQQDKNEARYEHYHDPPTTRKGVNWLSCDKSTTHDQREPSDQRNPPQHSCHIPNIDLQKPRCPA